VAWLVLGLPAADPNRNFVDATIAVESNEASADCRAVQLDHARVIPNPFFAPRFRSLFFCSDKSSQTRPVIRNRRRHRG